MLKQVLVEIEAAQGAIDLNELARKVGVERGALEGMIEYWVQKGRVKDDRKESEIMLISCATGTCAGSCPGPQGCPHIMKMPKTYTLSLRHSEPEVSRPDTCLHQQA